ncbi:MAG: iron ABC transporter permease, partial [Gluconacetobacter liquefaciens]
AGFGAALGIVAGASPMGMHLLSFVGGAVAVAAAVGVARLFDAASMLMLVFGGLVSTALFTALLSLLKYVADPDKQLPDIVFWLLGSLTQVTETDVGMMAVPVAIGVVGLTLCGRMLDALAMGDDEARTLGVPVDVLRYGVIAVATVLSAVTVSVAGMIGWIGLIVPHVARLLAGPCNARVLPLSACLGGGFLLICDDLARCVSVEEIPVGLVADLLGVCVFLCVLRLIRRGWVECPRGGASAWHPRGGAGGGWRGVRSRSGGARWLRCWGRTGQVRPLCCGWSSACCSLGRGRCCSTGGPYRA